MVEAHVFFPVEQDLWYETAGSKEGVPLTYGLNAMAQPDRHYCAGAQDGRGLSITSFSGGRGSPGCVLSLK
ncbi:MAG: hypothetical protein QOH35_1256 [Acidobacteriaceae bacterium]|jgi:hypothetical protein|nr:hypothetical protein [Acidobacteriaceae bacterium]MDX6463588.1 hypothetical protein [Acidobacteriaceae bacterium]MEA2259465.1 hypothetical protein [Acidobacteriaceae bacterium]MEA2539890.1 hypothetical protein [Acidobacteriaceae bacterium]